MPIVKSIKRPKLTTNDQSEEYLSHVDEPKDDFSNSDNLFDDSNQKDRFWSRIAKKYLGRRLDSTGVS